MLLLLISIPAAQRVRWDAAVFFMLLCLGYESQHPASIVSSATSRATYNYEHRYRHKLLIGHPVKTLLLHTSPSHLKAFWLIASAFVRWYEEPALTRRFGADYEA